jgi:NDP-sugar pyrophosphorylase family protein
MQIVIPMSGTGERFLKAGYKIPKPLLQVDGKPIIAHVIDLFPGETDFLFICNRLHLENPDFDLRGVLKKYCPDGKIVSIEPHKKGPVYAVMQAADYIKDEEPIIVNYCDFSCYWDYKDFKKFVVQSKCDGAIPSYRNFHPHSLGSTYYAYLKESEGWVTDIQEKKPYTDTPMREFASSGTYYFSSGKMVRKYFKLVMERDLNINGEYYVSLAYKAMLEECSVAVYELEHFMQWGTPKDLEEYLVWSKTFEELVHASPVRERPQGTILLPMAGLGKRFADEGYDKTKPLIEVSGRSMVVQAVSDLPLGENYVFVLRQEMSGVDAIKKELESHFQNCQFKVLESLTEGQASTCLMGMNESIREPLTIGACDMGARYSIKAFEGLLEDPEVDIIVWAASGHPDATRKPEMYGWILTDENGLIQNVSVKKPIGNPSKDYIVTGTFTFKNPEHFISSAKRMISLDSRVNGEFYVDSCINDAIQLGYRCKVFLVDHYISWGTPSDLRTYEYWQSCFHKYSNHIYKLDEDREIPREKVANLAKRFQPTFLFRPSKKADD